MTCDCDYGEKTLRYVNECRRLGITLLPPAINDSEGQFLPRTTQTPSIAFGLSAIKGLSGKAIEVVQQEREAHGKFKTLTEFIKRVDLTKVSKKNFELLAVTGCLDAFKVDRTYMYKNSNQLVKHSEAIHSGKKQRQMMLFDSTDHDLSAWQKKFDTEGLPSASLASLVTEKRRLGAYLSKHPLSFYRSDREFFRTTRLAALTADQAEVSVLAILNDANERMGKNQQRILWLTLEDETAIHEIALFKQDIAVPPIFTVVLVKLRVEKAYQNKINLSVKDIKPISELRRQHVRKIYLRLNSEELTHEHTTALQRLARICNDNIGSTPLHFVLCYPKIRFTLASQTRIDMNDEVLFQLQALPNLPCVIGYPRQQQDADA